MTEELRPIDPEELLAHSGWMKSLARGLVRDEATAEDLVQQAYAVALERPPRDHGALPAWLVRVLRNLAARKYRDEARRSRREERVAKPDQEETPIGDLLERAELQRAVMDAVLELEEPFRSTVLLRYYEERSPDEVAKRLGVPVSTVGTRLHRALEKLRTRLDRERGGRAAWVAIFAPWIGLAIPTELAAMSSATAEASAATAEPAAVAAGGSAATAAIGTAAGTATGTIGTHALFGGLFVMQKSFVVSVFAGAICSAIGFGIGRTSAPEPTLEEGQRIVAESEFSALEERAETAQSQLAEVQGDHATLAEEKAELDRKIRQLQSDLSAARAASAGTVASVETEAAPTMQVVSFGEFGDLAEIRNANWPELADAVIAINDLVAPLYDDIEAGRPISGAVQQEIAGENNKLVKFAVGLMEKIPSNAPMAVNGEFTHPISLINLMASMLESAGLPLTAAQRQQIAVIGARYDVEYAAMTSTYTDTTWSLTKILDELSLKRDTMLEVEEQLNAEQREIVIIERIQNRIRLDTLSPVNMVVMNVGALPAADAVAARNRLMVDFSQNLFFEYDQIMEQTDLLARYDADVSEIMTPVPSDIAQFAHLDDILIAGRAQERLLMDLAARVSPDEEQMASLRGISSWGVPQVLLPGEEGSATAGN